MRKGLMWPQRVPGDGKRADNFLPDLEVLDT